MSHESNKALLNIETHTLPDDYPFSVDELDRIIAGEVVSPHQAAIMARELKNDVRPKLLRQLRMITWRTCSGMRKNRFVTPTQIINASLAVWLRLVLLPPLSANSCNIAGLRKIIGRWYTHPALSFSAKMVLGKSGLNPY